MTRMKIKLLTLLLISVFCVAGCAQPVQVSSAEAASYSTSVDEIVENCLDGLSENDFEKHTRDFDSAMLEVVDPASFPQAYADIIEVIGTYDSKELSGVFDQAEFRIVVYKARFAKEEDVTVRFVFRKDNPDRKISGMWFDSELLRAAGTAK